MKLHDIILDAQKKMPLDLFPERDEEIYRILEDVFCCKRYDLSLYKDKLFPNELIEKFYDLLEKRVSGIPLAYVLGYTYFYHHKFPVSKETLIPRYDTEHLVESVRKHACHVNNILDLCTGTGVIALSLHSIFPEKTIMGIDIVDAPFYKSQQSLGFDSSCLHFRKMDFLDKTQWDSLGMWDCIVSNPPYLDDHDMDVLHKDVKEFEPHQALYGGTSGLLFYQAIADFAQNYLNPEGILVLETDHKHEAVSELFPISLYPTKKLICDYSDLPRVLILKKTS
ncbi:MAG: peptide chain release factor N(5)-glutamine methyltransferase [Brevinema sp.]